MGLLDKLFGHRDSAQSQQSPSPGQAALSAEDQAIGRYRYMLQTAPPHTLEQAHAEAFAKLTPDQRTLLLQRLSAELPEAERSAAHGGTLRDDPQSLARLATRAEIRQPGTLERSFGGMSGRGGAMGAMGVMGGMGGTLAGSFLASMAAVVIGSAIAQSFLNDTDVVGADAAADGTLANAHTDLADASDGGADDFDMGGFDEV